MKNTIKTFALFLTAGAMLASCDSYLDRQPDEPLTSDNIFKKQKTTLQYLTNIYSYQPDYEAPACVSNSNDIPWEACSDETSFAYLDRSYTQINYNSWNPSLPIYRDDTYNTPYKGIREANYFMQNVHKCPPEELNDVDKGYYYNEARFLRAHFYAMMLPVYGPIFLIGDDPVDFTQSGLDQRERNTWDECVNYVANELWEAAKGLPDSWPDIYYGRATKGAALAARARLLLYSARKLFNGNELYKGIVNKNGDLLDGFQNICGQSTSFVWFQTSSAFWIINNKSAIIGLRFIDYFNVCFRFQTANFQLAHIFASNPNSFKAAFLSRLFIIVSPISTASTL